MIKYLIMDVDGTLTDGKIYISSEGEFFKGFHVQDGYGIAVVLKSLSIEPVIITGRSSSIVIKRCEELGIEKVFQGVVNKLSVLKQLMKGNELDKCAYIGDDIPDLDSMNAIKKAGGVIGCPADAVREIREICDFVSERKAGEGAVRDFIEWLRENIK